MIVTDNGKQIDNPALREMCQELRIHELFSTPGHPQANGQVEVANKTIKDNLKEKLERLKGAWVDELSTVLWAHHMTPKEATGEMPFSLVFGTEAIIPAEVGFPSYRVENYVEQENNMALLESVDFLEEKRDQAAIWSSAQKHLVAKYYNSRGPTTIFPARRFGFKKSLPKYPGTWYWSVWTELGGPL